MAGETYVTVVGNLSADPELRFTPSGAAVANFTIASTPRSYDKDSGGWKDGDALFMRCNVWRQPAENVVESLTRGMRVMAVGRLKQRSFEHDGQKRTVVELDVDEVGPSMKYATAKVNKINRQGGEGGNRKFGEGQTRKFGDQAKSDPWSTGGGASDPWGDGGQTSPAEEIPF